MPSYRRRAALALCFLLAACDGDPITQLIVTVDSDYAAESQLRGVNIRVSGRDPTLELRIVASHSNGTSDSETSVALPFSFVVLPRSSTEKVDITIEGFGAYGELLGRDRRRVGFARNASLVVPMQLTARCRQVFEVCADDQTCDDGACESRELALSELMRVKPGEELDGHAELQPLAVNADAGPAEPPLLPERPSCDLNVGFFSDVGRQLARTVDGDQCPVITQGDDWLGAEPTYQANLAELAWYVERAIAARADVIGLNVAHVDGRLVVFGHPLTEQNSAAIQPTLAEAMLLPGLQAANQPLWLKLAELGMEAEETADALLEALRATSVVRSCRPVYMFSEGPRSFETLVRLRDKLRDSSDPLLSLLHFGSTLTAALDNTFKRDLELARYSGLDVVRFDVLTQAFRQLPRIMSYARHLGLAFSLFNSPEPWIASSLCGFASAIEQRVLRLGAADFRNETRGYVEQSRLLLELDTRELADDASELLYRAYPEVAALQAHQLKGQALVSGPAEELPAGSFLEFDKLQRHSLQLAVPNYLPENEREDEPALSLSLIVRFAKAQLESGERQVIASKHIEGHDSGWVLERRAQELAFIFYARGEVDGVVHRAELLVPTESFLQTDHSIQLISVQALGGTLFLQVLPQTEGAKSQIAPRTMHRVMNLHNDLPITIGSDPGGETGFFDGGIQLVRIVSL